MGAPTFPSRYTEAQRAGVLCSVAPSADVVRAAAAGELRGVDGHPLPPFAIPNGQVRSLRHRARRPGSRWDLEAMRERQAAAVEAIEGPEPRSPEEIAAGVEAVFRKAAEERERREEAERVAPVRVRGAEDLSSALAAGLTAEEARAIGVVPRRRRRVRGLPDYYGVEDR